MTITPKNWQTFQHYKDRSPTWIKLHRSILDDFAFSRLPVASRALAPMLWLLASEYEKGGITAPRDEIAFRLRMSIEELDAAIKPLIDAGFFVSASTPLATRKRPSSPEREERNKKEVEVKTEKIVDDDGDGSARATLKKSKPIPDEAIAGVLIDGKLWQLFAAAYPGPITQAAKRNFIALVTAGANADPIIAAAAHASRDMPATQWLAEQPWLQLPLPISEAEAVPSPKSPLVLPEASAIADEIAKIAGQHPTFPEPGWCGAAMRCQMWLTQGWLRDEIVAGVRAQVASKMPEKISNVSYFEKGLAQFIARQRRPVPNVVELKPETVEVKREATRNDSRSGSAAIRRVYAKLRAASESEHGGSGEMPEPPV